MYLDAFTLSALCDEFLDVIAGGRIQDVLDVDDTGIGLEIFSNRRRHYLYLSADPNTPRVHLVPDKLRRGLLKPTQLGLLLRRFAEGSTLTHVSQPAWERILYFHIDHADGELLLIIEPMERRSNLLLVQNGIIHDCLRRVGASENRVRTLLPGQPYAPPPPQQGKIEPKALTEEALENMFAQSQDPKRKAHQVLTANILGCSPLLAKETVFRAARDTDLMASKADTRILFEAANATFLSLIRRDWQPGIVEQGGRFLAFSVYPLQSMEGWRAAESLSAALTMFYTAPVGADAYNKAKEPVGEAIQEGKAKLNARLASLRRSLTDDSEREVLRQSGELILAYQYALTSDQSELRAQYDLDQPELVIKLDSSLTPLENAQRYFERYNKAKRALDDVPRLISENEAELALLDQLALDLELAANWPEIDEVQQTLQNKGYWRGKKAARMAGSQKSAPLRYVTEDGWVIWIGRNSRQNEVVTFEKGSPTDVWLHVRGVPGAHVIIKTEGRSVPEATLELAAGAAAYYSALRTESKVPVDVALRIDVRKIKGGGTGQVTYRNEKTRIVTPKALIRPKNSP
jgi:predicted ribosome quality control (RQC) complex YloA/Tae2 family protein